MMTSSVRVYHHYLPPLYSDDIFTSPEHLFLAVICTVCYIVHEKSFSLVLPTSSVKIAEKKKKEGERHDNRTTTTQHYPFYFTTFPSKLDLSSFTKCSHKSHNLLVILLFHTHDLVV